MNAEEIIQQISDKAEKAANIKIIFGDPIKQGEVTVIPVGSIFLKGGGGGGKIGTQEGDEKGKRGMGLGMCISTKPIGYIEVKNNEAKFVNIIDKTKVIIGMMVTLGLLVCMAIKSKMHKCKNMTS